MELGTSHHQRPGMESIMPPWWALRTNRGGQRASRLITARGPGRVGTLRGVSFLCPFPRTSPSASLPFGSSWVSSVIIAVPNLSVTRNRFPGGQVFLGVGGRVGSGGERWDEAGEASPPRSLLPSCCVAWFLMGNRVPCFTISQ